MYNSLTSFSFLKQHLGASGPETADVEALKLEVSELRQKCEQLQESNAELKGKVKQKRPFLLYHNFVMLCCNTMI